MSQAFQMEVCPWWWCKTAIAMERWRSSLVQSGAQWSWGSWVVLVPQAAGSHATAACSESQGCTLNGALCLCRDGNNLPSQCCLTSGFPATRSCSVEYSAVFLIYSCKVLAMIEAWLISHNDFHTEDLIHEEVNGLLRRYFFNSCLFFKVGSVL